MVGEERREGGIEFGTRRYYLAGAGSKQASNLPSYTKDMTTMNDRPYVNRPYRFEPDPLSLEP